MARDDTRLTVEIDKGKPVARRGRKARDLRPQGGRPVTEVQAHRGISKGRSVKQILARLSLAIMMLGAMALTTGAGVRWQA
jgi:hypothetical protein